MLFTATIKVISLKTIAHKIIGFNFRKQSGIGDGVSNLLLEDGGNLLSENSDVILME